MFLFPFQLSKSLRESTDLVTGSKKNQQLEETLDDPHILNSYGELENPVDIHRYLHEVPFYCSEDYEA